jgi:hypothetical protein
MKSHLLVLPLILATSAAVADAQRSALSARVDAQASAAALLRGHQTPHMDSASIAIEQPSGASTLSDAQTQAAALLRGSRHHRDPPLRAQTGAARAR